MAPPPAAVAPTLEAAGEDTIRVAWAVPQGVAEPQSFAAVSLRPEGSSRWLRVDARSGKLDEPDALPLPLKTTSCVVKGVDPKATYVARVRLGDHESGWGPDSPASKSLTLASLAPSAPAAPLLEAVNKTSLRVHFTLPPVRPDASAHGIVTVHVKAGNGAWHSVDATSSTLTPADGSGTAHRADSRVALVKGLVEGLSYRAKVSAKNACGWGAYSPVSEPLTLGAAALRPIAPAAPLLEAVDSTSLRVHFSPPPVRPGDPALDFVAVYVSDGGAWQTVDAAASTLKPLGRAFRAGVESALVKGLSEGVTYRAKVSVRNIHGWGAHSPSSEPLQLPEPASPVSGPASPVSGPVSGPASPEVEITGSKSREERDAELRKRSVDVDAEDDAAPASPRSKRSKKEGEAGAEAEGEAGEEGEAGGEGEEIEWLSSIELESSAEVEADGLGTSSLGQMLLDKEGRKRWTEVTDDSETESTDHE